MRPVTGDHGVAVAIMAKAPLAGQVKTRLCPPLSHDEAARLSRCFLLDKIEQVQALERARPVIAYAPEPSRELFETLAPTLALIPQRGPDLGTRLIGVLDGLLAAGHQGAIAIDSDTPTLPVSLLQQAVDRLGDPGVDVVVGPTEDGGYYLIGIRAPRPELFVEMPWSTSDVLLETLRRATRGTLRVVQLPPWYDVDTPDDLSRLRADLVRADARVAAHTRRFLQPPAPSSLLASRG